MSNGRGAWTSAAGLPAHAPAWARVFWGRALLVVVLVVLVLALVPVYGIHAGINAGIGAGVSTGPGEVVQVRVSAAAEQRVARGAQPRLRLAVHNPTLRDCVLTVRPAATTDAARSGFGAIVAVELGAGERLTVPLDWPDAAGRADQPGEHHIRVRLMPVANPEVSAPRCEPATATLVAAFTISRRPALGSGCDGCRPAHEARRVDHAVRAALG